MSRWIFLIVLGVFGSILFRTYGCEGIYVATPSMEPTIPVGTHFFVDKCSFLFRGPRRGEIVVLASPVDPLKDLVKRVIGLPGEVIEIKNKAVFISRNKLKEPYAFYTRKEEILAGDTMEEHVIPEASYFIMGDNRDESQDSTTWKDEKSGERIYFVKREQIKGRLMNVLE